MQTIDVRPRTSDGETECACCCKPIPKGEGYSQETHTATGSLFERNVCLRCLNVGSRGDVTIAVVVVGAALTVVGILAIALMG